MQNKQFYINEFKSRLKPWSIYSQDRTWYKPRFQYRLSFRFSDSSGRASAYSSDWRMMLTEFNNREFKFRHRSESYNVVFTSDHELLTAVLDYPGWLDNLKEFAYADDQYLSEFSNHVGIDAISDIRFVKKQPEYCYEITLGNFDWRRVDPLRQNITSYLAINRSDFLFKGRELEIIVDALPRRQSTAHRSNASVYHGFRFYAKSADDIIMLHMMAPGKVIRIVKLMEKKNETITS